LKVNKIKKKKLIRLYPRRIEAYRRHIRVYQRRTGDVSKTYRDISGHIKDQIHWSK
jgi:hypothetical protein